MLGPLVDAAFDALGFDQRTARYLKFDLRRLYTRLRHHRRDLRQALPRLHLGCGGRKVSGWLNCDITGSDFDIDVAARHLPFDSDQFDVIVSQHVIEHLDFDPVGIRLIEECHRILRPAGRIWISCPDLEKMCAAYVQDRCRALDHGRKRHSPAWRSRADFPVQHRINFYFHQWGEHRNLMDFEMLRWALAHAGFGEIRRANDSDITAEYPGFPPRNDDSETVLVTAVKARA